MIRKYDLVEREPVIHDHNYCDAPNIVHLSECKKAAISYTAGYVAQMVREKIVCMPCSQAVGSRTEGCFLEIIFIQTNPKCTYSL